MLALKLVASADLNLARGSLVCMLLKFKSGAFATSVFR